MAFADLTKFLLGHNSNEAFYRHVCCTAPGFVVCGKKWTAILVTYLRAFLFKHGLLNHHSHNFRVNSLLAIHLIRALITFERFRTKSCLAYRCTVWFLHLSETADPLWKPELIFRVRVSIKSGLFHQTGLRKCRATRPHGTGLR